MGILSIRDSLGKFWDITLLDIVDAVPSYEQARLVPPEEYVYCQAMPNASSHERGPTAQVYQLLTDLDLEEQQGLLGLIMHQPLLRIATVKMMVCSVPSALTGGGSFQALSFPLPPMVHDTRRHAQGVLRDFADAKKALNTNAMLMERQIYFLDESRKQARLRTSRLPAW